MLPALPMEPSGALFQAVVCLMTFMTAIWSFLFAAR